MEQLSGQDASFLYAESKHTPLHVGSVAIYDQSTVPGGMSAVPRDPELQRAAAASDEDAEAQGGAGAVRHRPSVLGRRQGLRPRIPHPPHCVAAARGLAAAVHPGVAHPCDAARHVEAAMGVVLRRRSRPRRRAAAALLRRDHQNAPLRHRRRVERRSRRTAARSDAGAAADSAADRSYGAAKKIRRWPN